jgi:hypothetical protein
MMHSLSDQNLNRECVTGYPEVGRRDADFPFLIFRRLHCHVCALDGISRGNLQTPKPARR